MGGYVTGRVRVNGEMNGKSANVNNALRNYIFTKWVPREGVGRGGRGWGLGAVGGAGMLGLPRTRV
jgi:hypothetical protein